MGRPPLPFGRELPKEPVRKGHHGIAPQLASGQHNAVEQSERSIKWRSSYQRVLLAESRFQQVERGNAGQEFYHLGARISYG